MIERYSLPEMAAVWSDQSRFEIWLEIETAALEGMVGLGLAPKEALDALRQKGTFDTSRVLEIEAEVKHDVIAFLTCVNESVGPLSRYIHRGMTSSDVLDTALAVQLKRSGEMILSKLDTVLSAVRKRAYEHKHTPCIGRSHRIHPEPVTFGLKLANWHAELSRQRVRFVEALNDVSSGKISGAVGTYASLPPQVEEHVMKVLGLTPDAASTQVVSRDRHAHFFSVLAGLASTIERCCVEVRHLQRTEVREVEEKFTRGQKGSSAMPHKRNPILSENLTGLARLMRAYASAALENVALWHERDISHSSVERIAAPDACILIHFMLNRFAGLVEGMVVYKDNMQRNLDLTGGLLSSATLLVALVDSGMKREDAYRLVQEHALAAWDSGTSFRERVMREAEICAHLSAEKLDKVFDLSHHFAHVDYTFAKVFGQG